MQAVRFGVVVAERQRPVDAELGHQFAEHIRFALVVESARLERHGIGDIARHDDEIGLHCRDCLGDRLQRPPVLLSGERARADVDIRQLQYGEILHARAFLGREDIIAEVAVVGHFEIAVTFGECLDGVFYVIVVARVADEAAKCEHGKEHEDDSAHRAGDDDVPDVAAFALGGGQILSLDAGFLEGHFDGREIILLVFRGSGSALGGGGILRRGGLFRRRSGSRRFVDSGFVFGFHFSSFASVGAASASSRAVLSSPSSPSPPSAATGAS